MGGEDTGVHHIDDASRTGVAAVVVTVEVAVELIDPIEMPEEIDRRIIAAAGELCGGVCRVQRHFDLAAIGGNDFRVCSQHRISGGQKDSARDESTQARTRI